MHKLPSKNTQIPNSLIITKNFLSFLRCFNELKFFWFHEWNAFVVDMVTSTEFGDFILCLGLCKMRHRAQMSHTQEVSCTFTYVKHFSLRRNIILIKFSLLHVSVVKKKKKILPIFPHLHLSILGLSGH